MFLRSTFISRLNSHSIILKLLPVTQPIQSRAIFLSSNFNKMGNESDNNDQPKSVYDFTVKDTYGNDVPLSKYKDNVLVIVNIASLCGLTEKNYKGLNELKQKYQDKGVKILAFPCNQFSNEMPENDGEEMMCSLKKSNADFGDIFQKCDVNGDNALPLYKFLKQKQGGFLGMDGIKWNFTKFLVDKNGQPVDRFAPTTSPESVGKKIEELLKQ